MQVFKVNKVPEDAGFELLDQCLLTENIVPPKGCSHLFLDWRPVQAGTVRETLHLTLNGNYQVHVVLYGTAIAVGSSTRHRASSDGQRVKHAAQRLDTKRSLLAVTSTVTRQTAASSKHGVYTSPTPLCPAWAADTVSPILGRQNAMAQDPPLSDFLTEDHTTADKIRAYYGGLGSAPEANELANTQTDSLQTINPLRLFPILEGQQPNAVHFPPTPPDKGLHSVRGMKHSFLPSPVSPGRDKLPRHLEYVRGSPGSREVLSLAVAKHSYVPSVSRLNIHGSPASQQPGPSIDLEASDPSESHICRPPNGHSMTLMAKKRGTALPQPLPVKAVQGLMSAAQLDKASVRILGARCSTGIAC